MLEPALKYHANWMFPHEPFIDGFQSLEVGVHRNMDRNTCDTLHTIITNVTIIHAMRIF